jgi:protoporphyrinogen oxidase
VKTSVVCIGAGPAGLTAAYLLSRRGVDVTVLESDPEYVGGISRTAKYKGFAFDIGGHRFFSKSAEVEKLWDEMLEEDFLERPRKSRIYYKRKLFDYPLKANDALSKLGALEAVLCVLSYVKAGLRPVAQPRNLEDWVVNKFGRRLFETFFKTYTEKVWGIRCSEISADWAAQRIKGLSLTRAVWHAVVPQRKGAPKGKVVKTLIDRFRYPKRGPGMLWEAAARKVEAAGGEVALGQRVVALHRGRGGEGWSVTARDSAGQERTVRCDHVISTMPIRELMPALSPDASEAALRAADRLRYRDFILVALVLKDREQFDDNWIYIHDPEVKVGRIQNFKSWSPDMVPDPELNCFGMEYFCFEGDELWNSPDADLVALATAELLKLGLAEAADVVDGTVVRQPKAYPVYDDAYEANVAAIRGELEARYPGLHLVGRNGMHKYNNQDHAMMTAMLTVENILAGRRVYDVWRVNQDAEYHEEAVEVPGEAGTDPRRGALPLGGRLAGAKG